MSIIILEMFRILFLVIELIYLYDNENLLEKFMFYNNNRIFDENKGIYWLIIFNIFKIKFRVFI